MPRGRCPCKAVAYEVSDEFVVAFNVMPEPPWMTGLGPLAAGEIEPEKLRLTKGDCLY